MEEAPLHQETANADLITDIVASTADRWSDIAGLAQDLTSDCPAWREAWSLTHRDPAT